jgi:DNA-binding transcriptional regulator YiaG
MNSESDRGRGILTPADREYLAGDRTYDSDQSERNARARIRDRVEAATYDFETLVEDLDERDRKLVFEDRFGEAGGTGAFDALVAAQAFLYQAICDTDVDFETVLREGINVAEATEDRVASVDLTVTRATRSVDALRRKLELGEQLSLTEIAFLQESDAVSATELARYLDVDRATSVEDGRIQSRVSDF